MRNVWLVAKHEYVRTVARRGFVILTLAIPLGMIAIAALAILVATRGNNNLPVGYVDHSGRLDASLYDALPDDEEYVPVRAFADEQTALEALEREEVQAVFIIPASYPQTLQTSLYYLDRPPGDDAWGDFDDFVRLNLVAAQPSDVQRRLFEGPSVTVHDMVSNREFSEENIVNVILPFFATFFFYFSTMTAAGYMLGVVASEKENRTMEIMLTSVTPGQLIGGKTTGLLAASLTQLGIYAVVAVAVIAFAAPHVPELQQVVVPWDYLALMVLFFLPSYALVAAIMVAIGGAVTDVQQGQQIAGILNLFFMAPILLLPILFENPGHPLMVFFTLFPTTSFLTISLRWGLGTILMWQIGLAWALLVSTTILMLWAAARIFRVGMLRYGQPLSFKRAVAAIRGS